MPQMPRRHYAIIIPAQNEAEAIGPVLAELQDSLLALRDRAQWTICVGVNASHDRTAELARRAGAEVAVTPASGYGHGCQAAIDHLRNRGLFPDAYVFMAADGANDPRDLARLVAAHDEGFPFVLGCRTNGFRNAFSAMALTHVVANWILGTWAWVMGGRFHLDLGPFRLVERELFERLALQEWTYGWTIEAQVLAGRLGVETEEISVRERPRRAGKQKVSGVNLRRTLEVGAFIFAAGWRARARALAQAEALVASRALVRR